jgi:hypothetical protein
MRPDKAKHPAPDRAETLQSVPDQVKVSADNYKSASRLAFGSFVPRRLTIREGVLAKDGDSPKPALLDRNAIDSTRVRCNHARH